MMNATATATPDLEESGGAVQTAATSDLVRAPNHGVRRSALRFLLQSALASTTEIRRGNPGFVGKNPIHHLDILVETGTLVRNRKKVGYRERTFEPAEAIWAPWFLTVLELTATEDRG